MPETKVCKTCKEEKPVDDFYRTAGKRVKWKYSPACKKCNCQRVTERYYANRDDIRSDHRDYYQDNSEHIKARTKSYRLAHREEINSKRKAYAELHKTERAAQNQMTKAIANGTLIKEPCENCGAVECIQGHHDDYDKPLDVRWLCLSCHKRIHGEMRMKEKS